MQLDLGKVLSLFKLLDQETLSLFMEFVNRAKNSSSPNQFLKDSLKRILEVEAKVVR